MKSQIAPIKQFSSTLNAALINFTTCVQNFQTFSSQCDQYLLTVPKQRQQSNITSMNLFTPHGDYQQVIGANNDDFFSQNSTNNGQNNQNSALPFTQFGTVFIPSSNNHSNYHTNPDSVQNDPILRQTALEALSSTLLSVMQSVPTIKDQIQESLNSVNVLYSNIPTELIAQYPVFMSLVQQIGIVERKLSEFSVFFSLIMSFIQQIQGQFSDIDVINAVECHGDGDGDGGAKESDRNDQNCEIKTQFFEKKNDFFLEGASFDNFQALTGQLASITKGLQTVMDDFTHIYNNINTNG
jgi:hypothetical protein